MAIQNLTNTQHNGWVYLPYYPNGWVYLPSQYSISCIGFLSHFILILRAHALQCYIPLYLTTCPFSCFWSLLLFFFLFVWLFVFNKWISPLLYPHPCILSPNRPEQKIPLYSFFCTNWMCNVCKFTRSWCIARANHAENKTHCRSRVHMKHHPNGNLKNWPLRKIS